MYPPYLTRTTRLITSGKGISRLKIFGLEDIFSIDTSNEFLNIPLEIFLEYTFTIDAEIITQSIQSALGSTVCQPRQRWSCRYRNLSDLIAVKTNNRDTSFRIKWTEVLADCQSLLDWTAAHICSILRMFGELVKWNGALSPMHLNYTVLGVWGEWWTVSWASHYIFILTPVAVMYVVPL